MPLHLLWAGTVFQKFPVFCNVDDFENEHTAILQVPLSLGMSDVLLTVRLGLGYGGRRTTEVKCCSRPILSEEYAITPPYHCGC